MNEDNIETNTPAEEQSLDDFAAELFGDGSKVEETPTEDANPEEPQDEETDTSVEEEEQDSGEEQPATEEEPTEEAEDSETSEDNSDEPEQKPKKQTAQERIQEINAKYRQEERERLKAEKELAELRAKLAEKPSKDQEPSEEKPVEPETPAFKSSIDFDEKNEDGSPKYPLGQYDPQYLQDVVAEAVSNSQKQMQKQTEEQKRQQAIQESQQALKQQWDSKVEATIEEKPDFTEKVQGLDEVFGDMDDSYAEYLGNTVMGMDQGTEVIYYLANNIDEAKEIVSGGPVKATIALAKLEDRLTSKDETKETKTTKVSSAPKPPPTNKGSGVVKTAVDPTTDSLDEFEKLFFKG